MRLRLTAALMAAIGLFPAGGWAQAAAEYGLAAGKAATATAGVASVLNKANRRVANAVGQKTAAATAGQAAVQSAKPNRVVAAQTTPATASQGVSTAPGPAAAMVIETGRGTINLGDNTPEKAQSSSPAKKAASTTPPAKSRYESVITLPAKQ